LLKREQPVWSNEARKRGIRVSSKYRQSNVVPPVLEQMGDMGRRQPWGTARNWGQISTFDIPFFQSADTFVGLLVQTAVTSRRYEGFTLVKSRRAFAARQRPNVKCLDATPETRDALRDATPFSKANQVIVAA